MFTIRAARPGDAAAILKVHREAIFAKAAGHYSNRVLDAWGAGPTSERVARGEQQIADPAMIVLVAEHSGEVIGFAVSVPAEQELRSLYVKPNSAGRVGEVLLAEVEKRAFASAEVLVCDASLNAVEFYKRHGYTEEGRTEHVLSSGVKVPCVRMQKRRPATNSEALK